MAYLRLSGIARSGFYAPVDPGNQNACTNREIRESQLVSGNSNLPSIDLAATLVIGPECAPGQTAAQRFRVATMQTTVVGQFSKMRDRRICFRSLIGYWYRSGVAVLAPYSLIGR